MVALARVSPALRTLEDAGYHCVDNLLRWFAERADAQSCKSCNAKFQDRGMYRCAKPGAGAIPRATSAAEGSGIDAEILYLDALSPTLVKRFSETRRRHPLTDQNVDLREAIDMEANILSTVADLANLTIDTTRVQAKPKRADRPPNN